MPEAIQFTYYNDNADLSLLPLETSANRFEVESSGPMGYLTFKAMKQRTSSHDKRRQKAELLACILTFHLFCFSQQPSAGHAVETANLLETEPQSNQQIVR